MQKVIVSPGDSHSGYTSQRDASTVNTERTTTYFDLGCKHQGLVGYFDPKRWSKTIDFGDGGVDVTEAPNATEVEGASGARLMVQTGSSDRYTWCITVPADGYLFFRLEKVGSFLSQRISSTDTDLTLSLNNEPFSYRPLRDGGYYSPFLEAGDVFGLSFSGPEQQYLWEEFIFYSNGVGVIVGNEGGLDPVSGKMIAAEVTPILKADMDQLFFATEDPETWPTFDQDADPETIDDQIIITPEAMDQQPFGITFLDRIASVNGQYWIMRRFLFEDRCSGNSISVERCWQPLPLIPNLIREDIR